jgi:murein DD-endopeptidase MepM/ murein hydrolase activator NlpD
MTHIDRWLVGLLSALLALTPVAAQDQCGTVGSIGFPVDPAQFRIAQDFGAPSMRHQGRYHTGEDWYGGRGTSEGQPVRAIAAGRVTYAEPSGWGRDRGVVIIQHTLPGKTTVYSLYGHLQPTAAYPFPARYTCVAAGDILGAIADIRPAPHVHFEVRTFGPDVPGPGYTWDTPTALGWRYPSAFVLNWQTWLGPAHRWHADLGDEDAPSAPPLALSDHSLLYLEPNRLRRLTPDGRVLWRLNLTSPAVGLSWLQESPLLTYADGRMQFVNADGSLGQSWETGAALQGAPINAGELLLFHTPDNTLAAFGPDRRTPIWQLPAVPPIARALAAPGIIGLITRDHQMLTVAPTGKLLHRAQLREAASLLAAPDGGLLAYTRSGLWRINQEGRWALALENTLPGGAASALAVSPDGKWYLLSLGAPPTLYAYSREGQAMWQVALPNVTGNVNLAAYDNVLLLTSSYGHIIVIQAATGAVCNQARVYGGRRAEVWHSLGDDGALRVAVAGQVLGLNWTKFLGACTAG